MSTTVEMRDIVASEGLTPGRTLSISSAKSSIYCAKLVHTSTVTCFDKLSPMRKWADGPTASTLGFARIRVNGTLVLTFVGLSHRVPSYQAAAARLDTLTNYSVACFSCAGVAQWESEGLIIPRPWVRFPPPAPVLDKSSNI